MVTGVRCQNLASSVGIVTYEALRQQGFNLQPESIVNEPVPEIPKGEIH
jgi:hypothetical protein